MSRPEVSLSNYEALYDHYQGRDPNWLTARTVHYLLGKLYSSRIMFEAGAQDDLLFHTASEGQVILAANHQNIHDQNIMADVAEDAPDLQFFRTNVNIVGKEGLFLVKPLRPVIESFGAIPAIRKKDAAKYESHVGDEETIAALRELATDKLIETCILKMNQGRHLAIFPEGRRGQDASQIGVIKRGIGEIACGVDDPGNILILPMGIHYGSGRIPSYRKPWVYFGRPFPVAETPDQVLVEVGKKLQFCLDRAIGVAENRVILPDSIAA